MDSKLREKNERKRLARGNGEKKRGGSTLRLDRQKNERRSQQN